MTKKVVIITVLNPQNDHMRISKQFLAVMAALVCGVSSHAQVIDSTLQRYSTEFQQERIYFHFDRSSYFPGDTIWYKAYIKAGWDASKLSRSLYTDWTDASGNLILHGLAPIAFSGAYGQIVIPKNYTQGTFHLHAYTGWMLNFDKDYLFDKDITVIQQKGAAGGKLPAYNMHVSLLPEGGNLVQSLMSTIAFKAENQSGRPVNITGALRNKSGEVIDSIFTEHDGMGKFFLNPEAGEMYSVSWKADNGDSGVTRLPDALPTGALLKVSASSGKISFHIDRSADAPANFKNMHVLGTMQQVEAFNVAINLEKSTGATNTMPASNLPGGILQLTLFDAAWKPVAERIIFVNNSDYQFTTSLGIAKKDLKKRGRNEIEIQVPDSMDASLSVSVTDAGLAYDDNYNIISHLLLTSDLRGHINNPAYYFSDNSDSVKSALDLVMLTNGWRRYNWSDVVAGKTPEIKHPRETVYVDISGQAMLPDSTVVSEGSMISLNLQSTNPGDSLHMVYTERLRDDGTFKITPGAFYDSLHISYKLLGSRKTANKGIVSFTTGFLPPLPNYHNLPFVPTREQDSLALLNEIALKAKADELTRLLGMVTLKNVTVTAKTKNITKQLDEKYASSVYQSSSTGNTYSFDVMHDPAAKGIYSLGNYLTDKVPGLQVQMNGSPPVPTYFFRPNINMHGEVTGRVQVYLDELPTDDETASTVQIQNVAYVKFYKPGALVAARNNPALAIYTRRGDDDSDPSSSVMKNISIPGYTPAKEFYSPDYASEPEALGADARLTLYWNPNVLLLGQQRSARIAFYNNDMSKRLRVVVEGMSLNGKLTRVERIIE